MDLVLYLDMDCYVYKTALSIPKTSDLSWLSSPHGYHPVPRTLYPLVAILDPSLNHSTKVILRNTKSFQKAPLSAALPSHLYHLLCLERQASLKLEPVLDQILRPHLGHRPLAVITT
jgi:hypothetical protein